MQTLALPESTTLSSKLDECSISDTDYFFKILTKIKGKGVKPDVIAPIITNSLSKWLTDFAGDEPQTTQAWRKKKVFIETLVGMLPPEKDAVPCSLLLKILRAANMVGADGGCRAELEKRVSWQLDEASLGELMIPCFSNGSATTFHDIELVIRLVRRFLNLEEVARSGAALMRVAKLVDGYIAEAAVDSHFTLPQFFALATALPGHARSSDDRLYRAIDIYLKAHPSLSKQERKSLCTLIESRKLSAEASTHAAQNERLPVRAVIQVLLSEQDKLSRHIDLSGYLSPGMGLDVSTARCLSKREVVTTQQLEIKRLKEDVLMLQSQCLSMERQIEKLSEKKKGYFSWKKLGMDAFKGGRIGRGEGGDAMTMNTPMQMKARLVGEGRSSSQKWRN